MHEIIKAKELGFPTLNEASLGRVYQHVKEGQSFAILTSWRQNLPTAENKTNFKSLQNSIRSAGLGFFKLLGHWKEEGQDEATAEPSLFVPGISKELAHKLGNKFDQDAVVYSGPETEGNISLIFKSGSLQKIGKFSPSKVSQAYSSVKGKTFVFEGFEYIAQSYTETLIAYVYELKRGAKP